MFLALILSVAMADTLTLESGARLTGDLATYEHGGNCYIAVTEGELAGSIVVVMCDQITQFERGARPVAAVEVPAPQPTLEPVPEEQLAPAPPVVMQAMIVEESPFEQVEQVEPIEQVALSAEAALAEAAPVVAEAAPEAAPVAEAAPVVAEATPEPPPAAPPPAQPAAPSWRPAPPPPVASGRVASPSRAPTVREPGGTGGATTPASAYSQPLDSEGSIGR